MKEISVKCYVKKEIKWELTYTSFDPLKVYQDCFNALLHKKIHKCSYITSIKDTCNYDGTRTITVYYNNNCKYVYIVED